MYSRKPLPYKHLRVQKTPKTAPEKNACICIIRPLPRSAAGGERWKRNPLEEPFLHNLHKVHNGTARYAYSQPVESKGVVPINRSRKPPTKKCMCMHTWFGGRRTCLLAPGPWPSKPTAGETPTPREATARSTPTPSRAHRRSCGRRRCGGRRRRSLLGASWRGRRSGCTGRRWWRCAGPRRLWGGGAC